MFEADALVAGNPPVVGDRGPTAVPQLDRPVARLVFLAWCRLHGDGDSTIRADSARFNHACAVLNLLRECLRVVRSDDVAAGRVDLVTRGSQLAPETRACRVHGTRRRSAAVSRLRNDVVNRERYALRAVRGNRPFDVAILTWQGNGCSLGEPT